MDSFFRSSRHGSLCIALAVFLLLLGCSKSAPTSTKAHHKEDGFRNVHAYPEKSFGDFLKWRWEKIGKEDPRTGYTPERVKPNLELIQSSQKGLQVTWIGHATALVQMDGLNILTDPLFSKRTSPVTFAGPKRVTPPGVVMENLPPIDVVVISHDHYDALDKWSIINLKNRPNGKATIFFVPLGLKKWLTERGVENVIEMDWWDTHKGRDFSVTAVPNQHWSKRRLFGDAFKTLWSGWVIEKNGKKVYFAGDTGYCPHFKDIGKRLGPFDLSLIPIGAYEPRWFMKSNHVNPEEAVRIHEDVNSKLSVAIHWGTYVLTDEPLREPPLRLQSALKEKNIDPDTFRVLRFGETLNVP